MSLTFKKNKDVGLPKIDRYGDEHLAHYDVFKDDVWQGTVAKVKARDYGLTWADLTNDAGVFYSNRADAAHVMTTKPDYPALDWARTYFKED